METVGTALKEFHALFSVKTETLARELGIDKSQITLIEKDERHLNKRCFLGYCKVFEFDETIYKEFADKVFPNENSNTKNKLIHDIVLRFIIEFGNKKLQEKQDGYDNLLKQLSQKQPPKPNKRDDEDMPQKSTD